MSDTVVDEQANSTYYYYVTWFVALLIVQLAFHQHTRNQSGNKEITVTARFKSFQFLYVSVYLVMMAADWLQGPYVYALYQHYGFTIGEIGQLFIVGFGTSMVCGTFIGSLADKYGRKKMCLAFGLMYGLSCITKHFPSYRILLFGRILGGISTSILFSSFESWMVHEHHTAGYPDEWLALTFSICTAGNGIVAIGAGVVASFVRDSFGPVAPFDTSLVLLLIGSTIVFTKWAENTGDSHLDLSTTVNNAWTKLKNDPKIWMLGLTQSFFEGAMYVFVFMWTPALESVSTVPILHGWIFACFMICVLIGSNLFKYLVERKTRVEVIALNMFAVSAVSLVLPAFVEHLGIRLLSFFVFEVCCGIFWPALGYLRSQYVPEDVRATTMNIFRVPLNLIVVLVLVNISKLSQFSVFMLCGLCLLPAFIFQYRIVALAQETELEDSKLNKVELQETSKTISGSH